MHFYEASIITTKDGIHCQVYGNEHPTKLILVKPKYIPTEKIESDALQYRFISGKRMNRLSMWADKEKLKEYIENFKKAYPDYIFNNPMYFDNRLFFSVPIEKIERIYFPKRGFSELMKISKNQLDNHLKSVSEFGEFILKSRLSIEDVGITYSTLMGHYLSDISDINLIIYGKQNYLDLMKYMETASHPKLRWKNKDEWLEFRKKRNRSIFFTEEEFLYSMLRKKSEGYFGNSLFVIFCAEKENEVWFRWGKEKYTQKGFVKVRGKVTDNFNSIVRPGCYEIINSEILEGLKVPVKRIVFYSRDYSMIAYPGEKIESSGVLEEVQLENGEKYYRVVTGYFDSYITERREKEYIKVIKDE